LEDLRRRYADRTALLGPDSTVLLGPDTVSLALGCIARAEGHYDDARSLIHGALRHIHQRGEGAWLRSAMCMAGMLEIARGETARGVVTIAACDRGEGPIGTIHVPDVRAEVPGFLEQARQTLGESAYAAAWAAGQTMTLEQAIAHALAAPDLPQQGELATDATVPAPIPARRARSSLLTAREHEVATLVARGLTNREIAAVLVVTEHTAMRHVEHILGKLGLRSRVQIAAWAVAQAVAGDGRQEEAPPS
jgi:non-specific serine/threonine protein kinase